MSRTPLLVALALFSSVLVGSAVGCSSGDDSSGGSAQDGDGDGADASTGDDGGSATDDAATGSDASPTSCAKTCKGCCDGETCVKPTTADACGAAGAKCTSCTASADGHACVSGSCGCAGNGDCGGGDVCDTSTHRCAKACSDASPCATGCCGTNGLCSPGTDSKTCGASGTCNDCSASAKGKACVAGGCGCDTKADCASGMACDTTTHTCTTTCSDSQVCNNACCSAGTCSFAASTCAGNAAGNACVGSVGKCGCNGQLDCPMGESCDNTTHTCSTKCSATQTCNGGCCNAGTCDLGTTDTLCGGVAATYVAPACFACGSGAGGHCFANGVQHSCGACTTVADCSSAASACQGGRCCLPKGAVATANPRDCCSDVISSGFCL